MASVVPRKNKAGDVTSYQVKWRLGGKGDWQTERFDGESGEDAAKVFKDAVDEAGQQWPPGWVKGRGYIAPDAAEETSYRFEEYARKSIENRTAGPYYKRQRIRALETYIFPTFGNCDVRSAEHFSKATIGAWINLMQKTTVQRGGRPGKGPTKLMSPETLRGLHGLLSSVLREATIAEPPLRERNPCELTRLPKGDDHGIADDERGDEMEFMTPEEVAGLVSCFLRETDRMLVRTAYGTGLRWGEITALATRHVRSPSPGTYEVRVTRAWKRLTPSVFELGPPKTAAGRRTVEITEGLWQELQDFGLAGAHKDELVFRAPDGGRLIYTVFWERWKGAVGRAKKKGLLPEWKFPTFHDLRHSHVAALLSDGTNSLTYVQRRLGHESIKTTSDRYGHLLETAHKAALATMGRVLDVRVPSPGGEPTAAPVGRSQSFGQVVHVLRGEDGEPAVAFWDADDAAAVAEQWGMDLGGRPVVVDKVSAAWWARSGVGGLEAVRREMPGRVRVWSVGPAAYGADGTEHVGSPEDHEPRARWVWDWERDYTVELATYEVDFGAEGRTEASAWGLSRTDVVAAYGRARAEALRVCGRGASGRETAPGAHVQG